MGTFIDLTGEKFGRLNVISLYGKIKGRYHWNCRCECGTLVRVSRSSLRAGHTKSCGCLNKEVVSKYIDLTGQKFNRLEVKSLYGKIKNRYHWNCICDCGNLKRVEGTALKSGITKSCGCLNKELAKSRATIHGEYANKKPSKEMRCWHGIKSRCYNKNEPHYNDYGGRGIEMCDRWLNSFERFLEDLGRCPKGMTLDRINNNGSYSPDNCRWATWKEQNNNRRSNKLITYNGETKTLSEWATLLKIKTATLGARLKNWDNDVERAFTTPIAGRK